MSTATLPAQATPPTSNESPAVERLPRSELAPAQPPFAVYRFSVEQYHAMIDYGILDEDDKAELLEGWIVARMTLNPPHCTAMTLLQYVMAAVVPPGWHTRPQSPVTLDNGEPEPDFAVVRGAIRDYLVQHPQPDDVGTLVEISDSTLQHDRTLRRGGASSSTISSSNKSYQDFSPCGFSDTPEAGNAES